MAQGRLAVFARKAEREGARAAFGELLAAAEAERLGKVDAEIARLKSPADVRRWQGKVRRDLCAILGEFPRRTPLRPQRTGRIDRRGVTIEKIIIESRPRCYLTANLYVPTDAPLPAPGVLVPCGHAKLGKGYALYRDAGLGLALKGYVAMVFDPTGQGERSECFDPRTGRHWVHREVPQHHYTGKPLFLTGLTLAGWRTWDGIRCLDYLCSRPEVDASRIGVMGNSGGGAMTMLISAVDERVTACAASHPGGSLENTHLRGRRPPDRLLYSLLAPRPCRIIVGDASGETRHLDKLNILKPFYAASGCLDRLELVWVDGKHDLKTPKRVASYEWLNRWLGRETEPSDEPAIRTVSEKALFCTGTGQVLGSITDAETMQTLNAKRARKLSPKRTLPTTRAALTKSLAALRRAVTRRIGFVRSSAPLSAAPRGRVRGVPGVVIEKLVFQGEPGLPVPALLFLPTRCAPDAPAVVHAAETGKPNSLDPAPLPLRLAQKGFPTLSIDVRDTGETSVCDVDDSDTWPTRTRNWRNFNGSRWTHDELAIRALSIGRSRTGMRTLDLLRALDLVTGRRDLAGRRVALVGEGRGGVWALIAAALDRRVDAVAAVRTLGSYRLLTDRAEYNQFEHFWEPGALLDYDLPDLPALAAPRPAWVLDPVDQMSRRLGAAQAKKLFRFARGVYALRGRPQALSVHHTGGTSGSVACTLGQLLAQLSLPR